MIRTTYIIYFLTGLLLWVSSCSMDIPNPNQATDEEALSSQQGLIALSVGMRVNYSTDALSRIIITPGVTSRELGAYTTFVNYLNLEEGGNAIQNDNSWTSGLWSRLYRIVGLAESILENNTPEVVPDAGIRAGLNAHALFFKAAALGHIIQAFEQAPITTMEDGEAPFLDRTAVLEEVTRLLEEALQQLSANPPSDAFYQQIGTTLDLPNMIQAYLSRYYLQAGDYQAAVDAANAVDLSSVSEFPYESEQPNPIWSLTVNSNDFRPLDNFGLEASQIPAGDGRIDFFLVPADTFSAALQLPVEDLKGYFSEQTASLPVYLTGEVLLNKAEAQARLDQLPAAVTTLNQVRTKTNDPFGVNADLTPYAGAVTQPAILEDIYINRALELFMTGLRLEDSRRFSRPGPEASSPSRTRNFYPYPDTERANNPNTPGDPAV
uniref:RagB/SusD family nutrient uptake outer membrane protein n=1 Tax=Roseihalotalea indica TaxID=2867963 RepID=A0AA49GRB4_9BACT|nr:RagB/SusD family nutrient uptake outer membrane protein [Tunicatimonas sp. TK19036]